MKKYRLTLILGSIVTLLPMVLGLILWDRLPDSIPVHWSASGKADGVAGPWVVVLLLPLLLLALEWFGAWLSFRDHKTETQNPKAMQIALWIVPIVSLFSSGIIYAGAFGSKFSLFRYIPILLGLLLMIIGNYMPKISPNSHLGIKTSWTFYTEENWHATHRFCGKVWFGCGFLFLFGVFIPEKWFTVVLIIPMAILVLSSMLYPYLYYRKQLKEGLEPIPKKPLTKKRLLVILAVVIAVIIGACALVYTLFTGDIIYHWGETSFTIEADFWTDLTVEYDAISSLEYQEDASRGYRTGGFNSPRLTLGSYRSDTYESYTCYTYTQCDCAILIHSGNKILMINGETPEITSEIFATLKEKIQ